MTPLLQLNNLIAKATPIVGSQRKLAALLGLDNANLVQMKNGTRPCGWRVRGKLRAIIGEDPTQAFMTAMAEDLETSENEDEKKAATGFKAMLAAFPAKTKKNPVGSKVDGVLHTGGTGCFRLDLGALAVLRTLRNAVHRPLHNGLRNIELLRKFAVGHTTRPVLSNQINLAF